MRKSDVIRGDLEYDESLTIIDPRTSTSKIYDALEKPWMVYLSAAFCALWVLLMPGAFFLALMVHCFIWMAVTDKMDVLPVHLPFGANKIDENNPKPGGGRRFEQAEGGFYFGRINSPGKHQGMEVWASFPSIMRHILLFGTTGAGKTESIVSFLTCSLSVGSGFIFNDAKAAPKAMIQIATIMRVFGRDDDMRVVNYITGGATQNLDPASRISNDLAAFARGSGETITQLLVSLMPESGGDNKIFSERAIALASAILPALTDLRDLGLLQIEPEVIREHMAFNEFVKLYNNPDIKLKSRNAMLGYLKSLPGYSEDAKPEQQPEECYKQFSYAQSYFTRTLASLSDTYGHIYMVGQGEVDWEDAVLHGRGVITLLPSLEKAGEELANLGKIVLTGIRSGMVVGLGTVFEGSTEDVAYNLPTNSEVPFFVFNDENAYMLTEGQDILNAQARGLGFCVLTGTQDASGMLESILKTTKQIFSNSGFKIAQYIDDTDTTNLVVEWSGEASVLVKTRMQRYGDMGDHFATAEAEVVKRPRITSTAVKRLATGEAYIMHKGEVHSTTIYNHGLSEKVTEDRANCWIQNWYSVRMAKISRPTKEQLLNLQQRLNLPAIASSLLLIDKDTQKRVEALTRMIDSGSVLDTITGDKGGFVAGELPKGVPLPEVVNRVLQGGDDNHLGSPSETVNLIAKIMADKGLEFAQLAEGESERNDAWSLLGQVEQDEFDDSMFVDDDDDTSFDSPAGGGGQGSGGGLGLAPVQQVPTDNSALLSGYGVSITGQDNSSDPLASARAAMAMAVAGDTLATAGNAEAASEQPALSEITTDYGDPGIADMVRSALPLMPWFAKNEKQAYTNMEHMVQTEMFVMDIDEAQAKNNTNRAMAMLLDTARYPKSSPPDAGTVDLSGLLGRIQPGG